MSSIGPFSLRVALVAGAVLVAWGVARALARRQIPVEGHRAPALLLDAVLVGFLVARLAYIGQWWEQYRIAPTAMFAIGDGGFIWWAGLPAAILFLLWRGRKARRGQRWPALAGMAAGMLAWLMAAQLMTALFESAPPLPELVLETRTGGKAPLPAYLGRPVVVNLWATWCPPCRREMPVFADAQRRWPGVAFLMINQGDERGIVDDYLQRAGLELDDVLLDAASHTMRETGARVLPTTLFYAADGRLVDMHVGELTRATLADRLQRRLGVAEP